MLVLRRKKGKDFEIRKENRLIYISKSFSFSSFFRTTCSSSDSGFERKRREGNKKKRIRRGRSETSKFIINRSMQLVNDEEPATIAVVIDKDKNASQSALKWALDNLVIRGQTITLVYVNIPGQPCDANTVFLPFRCFCTRKDVKCNDVVLQDNDMVKAIIDFVSETTVEKLVVGAPSSKGGFVWRMKSSDYTASISKGAPDFCSVYTISKGKVSSLRNATRAAPTVATHLKHQMAQVKPPSSIKHDNNGINRFQPRAGLPPLDNSCSPRSSTDRDTFRSPFARGGGRGNNSKFGDFPLLPETDISFVGGRPSNDFLNSTNSFYNQRLSCPESFDHSFDMSQPSLTSYNNSFAPSPSHYNNGSGNNNGYSSSSNSHGSSSVDDVEAEMKRLRLELKQTMDMYSSACKEAITAKQRAIELNQYKKAEDEAAAGTTDMEKARIRAAKEAAEASKRIAELEAQKRISAEKMSMSSRSSSSMDSQGKNSMMSGSGGGGSTDIRYRRYTIEEIETATDNFSEEKKIGEGGYGPVYRGYLDHTPVAIKVLRPDAAQGRSQFNQEIEILSCIRHPNMVLLLGACPEYGCLVYEYMANGSLEDRLFRKGNTPPISWQQRFRIAAEIGTGLLFLHQTKPEPLVHRDLKPANILLDRNYGSKIADVGLARLVPPTVADSVTQYLMTSTAGTFCYIDPEYQQTGMLGVKSDIYSLGIMLLQIITAKPPMGLTHHVERAIDKGTFEEILDPAVPDWPVPEALALAKVAIKCAELRKKDRPDLNTYIIPTLNKLRDIADNDLMSRQQQLYPHPAFAINHGTTPRQSQVSMEDSISNPLTRHSGYESRSSGSS